MKHIDWNDISELGLLERINKQVMHPLGLAVYRTPVDGMSGGAIIADDGLFTYPPELTPLDVLTEEQIREKVTELTKQVPANVSIALAAAILELEQLIAELKHSNDALKAENGVLAAQNQMLNAHFKTMQAFAQKYLDPQNATGDYEFINQIIYLLDGPEQRKAQASPQQCLNEIKAEAGRAGYLQALRDSETRIDGYYATSDAEDAAAADKYAESIRNGGAE